VHLPGRIRVEYAALLRSKSGRQSIRFDLRMLNTNPPGVDRAHVLPPDWRDQVLSFTPLNILEPLVNALKSLVQHHGEAAIAIEHVQELALLACGMGAEYRFRGHQHVFTSIVAAAGGSWPITIALEEQQLHKKPVIDAAQRLTTCDGEWLALHGLLASGWEPVQNEERIGGDWTIARGTTTLPVEVKTKQSAGSDLGRLRFALRGLAMLPEADLLRRFTAHWSGATDLRRKTTAAFYEILRANLARIDGLVSADLAPYDRTAVGTCGTASLTLQRFDHAKFALDFEDSGSTGGQANLSLILEPNRYPNYVQVGAVDAHFLRPADAWMLDELEEKVLDRLGIQAQSAKRSPETVVVVIWEVPFHWTLDIDAVSARWRAWAADVDLRVGVLLPIRAFEPPTMLTTPEASALFPDLLNIFA
jgi:hypothetical protein